ncbi:MAG TPA: hypothetical protein VFO10_05330 [Oligoflexus sp.]|uniref:hypothetical protein n=1 Tax=Oligoflexus sp. TaxID=1971216 RepID=UPI002D7FE9F9|nr:hypothetical protein [Oligoflexus sp.]HET9236647.1 hypothetical protein [Oligoflexus sp.]
MQKLADFSLWFFSLLFVTGCASPGSGTDREGTIPADVDRVVTGDELAEPSAYVGKNILVRGEISKILSNQAFILSYGGGLPGPRGGKILVLQYAARAGSLAVPLTLGARMEVVGPVRLFNLPLLENELNVNLSDDLFAQYKNEPVLIARSVIHRT